MSADAAQFLKLLDPATEHFTFQTFHDLPSGIRSRKPDLAQVLNTTINDTGLHHLHRYGAGVFVTVNRTDLRGRKGDTNIIGIRAIWQEDDDGYRGTFPLAPSIVVETSPNHFHRYWLTDWPADKQGRADFAGVMRRMVTDYGSDPGAKDISRVLRVPGFLHRKNFEPFMVRMVEAPGHRYSREEILQAFPPIAAPPKETPTSAVPPRGEIARALGSMGAIHRLEDIVGAIGSAAHGERND
jgi:RepB DNA-primase from phage plasmid